jgi:hypothetical protein
MADFDFKRRNLISGPHLLGVLLVAAGLFALVSPMFLANESSWEKILRVGAGAILLGLFIWFSYGGTRIDLTKHKVKEYYSVGGYQFGVWESLPTITTVKVVTSRYRSSNIPNGISPTLSGTIVETSVLLHANEANPILSFTYSNRAKAMKIAGYLATHLHSRLEAC